MINLYSVLPDFSPDLSLLLSSVGSPSRYFLDAAVRDSHGSA